MAIEINLQGGISPITRTGVYELIANDPATQNTVIIRVECRIPDGEEIVIVLPSSQDYSDGRSPIIYVISNNFTATTNNIILATRQYIDRENQDYINGGLSVTIDVGGGNVCVQSITTGVYIANGTIINNR